MRRSLIKFTEVSIIKQDVFSSISVACKIEWLIENPSIHYYFNDLLNFKFIFHLSLFFGASNCVKISFIYLCSPPAETSKSNLIIFIALVTRKLIIPCAHRVKKWKNHRRASKIVSISLRLHRKISLKISSEFWSHWTWKILLTHDLHERCQCDNKSCWRIPSHRRNCIERTKIEKFIFFHKKFCNFCLTHSCKIIIFQFRLYFFHRLNSCLNPSPKSCTKQHHRATVTAS